VCLVLKKSRSSDNSSTTASTTAATLSPAPDSLCCAKCVSVRGYALLRASTDAMRPPERIATGDGVARRGAARRGRRPGAARRTHVT